MAFEQLFVRVQKSLGGIQLDAVISENHSNSLRLTKNPIELGADITDAIVEPKQLSIVAYVSDSPLGAAAFGEIVDLITGLFGSSTTSNITRSNAAYNAMVQLMEYREPIEVQTKLKLYSNMMITSLTASQDKNSSRMVAMNISLEEVIITESLVVKLDPGQLQEGSAKEQGSSPEKKGRQEPVAPSETTNKSVLKSVLDWL